MLPILPLFSAALLSLPPVQTDTPVTQRSADSVLVSFEINAGYDDSETSIRELSELLEVLPPGIAVVRLGEDLPRLILRLYTVSDTRPDGKDFLSRLPATYRLLSDYILQANELDPESTLRTGDTLRVPAAPPLASPGNPDNPYNSLPIVRRFRSQRFRLGGDSSRVMESVVLLMEETPDTLRAALAKGQQRVRLEFWTDTADARALQTQFGAALRRKFNVRVEAERWQAAFSLGSADSIGASAEAVPRSDSAALARALAMPGTGHGYLLILDSGWPHRAAAEKSVQYLRELFDSARSRWKISGGPVREGLPAAFASPRNDHVTRVHEALRGLEALDPQDRVRVIYVPNTREQNGSIVLEELLFIASMMDYKRAAARGGPNRVPERMLLDPRYAQSAKNGAAAKVRSLPSYTPADGFAMDGDIVQALIDVVNTAVEWQKRAAVYSASWVVQQNVVSLALPSPLWGVAVVAAGNENGRNIYGTPPVDFAQRTAEGRQFMAVATMDETGPRCGTSEASSPGIDDMLVAGYNGWLPEMRWDCGSSFATPRVGWFLAASESLRDGDASQPLIGRRLLDRLRAMRAARRDNAKSYLLFSPGMLLSR